MAEFKGMSKEDGLDLLVEVIKNEIYHQDYERVTELAKKYFAMKTGKDLTDLLQKILTRESEDEFKQRKEISKSVIPSILNSTMLPFQKAVRKQPLLREIIFDSGEAKKKELEDVIGRYWGEKSVEEFLEYAVIEYNYIDPNAFLITEFEAFDSNKQKAEPYPFIATSEDAIMFEYKNENLRYLIIRLPIKYKSQDAELDGYKYTMYLGNDTIQLTQVATDYVPEDGEETIEIEGKENMKFIVQYFEPKAKKVPAVRFGYIRDAETKGRTFVSVFHSVLLLLEKLMKTDSELDLTTAMTAFPQRLMWVDSCPNPECNGGKLLDGIHTCETCGGTGKQPFHRSVADIITFKMPKTKEEMIDLEQVLVYKTPPIELLDFNQKYIDNLRTLIHYMMFNNEVATVSETTQNVTATEKNYSYDNMNDTLYPFARNYSSIWEFVVEDIATFTDFTDFTLHHKFPNDFKFKSLVDLMNELKTAKDAGASTSTISAIEDDINEILYSDRPSEKKKIEIKSLMNPFRGYPEATVRLLISQGLCPEINAVIWSNLESIFNELELESPGIYEDSLTKIRAAVMKKAEEYNQKIKDEMPEPTDNVTF